MLSTVLSSVESMRSPARYGHINRSTPVHSLDITGLCPRTAGNDFDAPNRFGSAFGTTGSVSTPRHVLYSHLHHARQDDGFNLSECVKIINKQRRRRRCNWREHGNTGRVGRSEGGGGSCRSQHTIPASLVAKLADERTFGLSLEFSTGLVPALLWVRVRCTSYSHSHSHSPVPAPVAPTPSLTPHQLQAHNIRWVYHAEDLNTSDRTARAR
jgi:hypothetical protein